MKNLSKLLLIIIILILSVEIENVNAVNMIEMDEPGLYCKYKDETTNLYYSLVIKALFQDNNISLETDDFPVLEHTVNKSMSNPEIIEYFLELGLYVPNENGNYLWNCPDSSKLDKPGLTLVEKGCYQGNCDTSVIPFGYEKYTCKYKGQESKKDLIFTVSYDQGLNAEVNYPDGTTAYLSHSKAVEVPSSDCEDVFYSNNKKKFYSIWVQSDSNTTYIDEISKYCDEYSDLEQFCNNGTCKLKNVSCEEINNKTSSLDNGECPKALKTITFFIKKIIINIIQIFVPIVLILMGTIDLAKAVMASDDKVMKDAVGKLIKRIIYAIAIFFVVTIVTVVMDLFAKVPDIGAQNTWKSCWFDNE